MQTNNPSHPSPQAGLWDRQNQLSRKLWHAKCLASILCGEGAAAVALYDTDTQDGVRSLLAVLLNEAFEEFEALPLPSPSAEARV